MPYFTANQSPHLAILEVFWGPYDFSMSNQSATAAEEDHLLTGAWTVATTLGRTLAAACSGSEAVVTGIEGIEGR